MYHNQMTYNGLPSSSASPPPFISQGFLFHSADPSHHLSPILPTALCADPQDFGDETLQPIGGVAMLGMRSFWSEEIAGGGCGAEGEDLSDECLQPEEKKRRLNVEQVRTLERNFELGNKLEPERRMQLARALGLQPRQISIWFQNRRARWKTKQLEIDYEALKREFDIARSHNDALHARNRKLQSELLALKGREGAEPINLNRETDHGSSSNRSENSSDINWDMLTPNQNSRQFFNSGRPASNETIEAKVENGGGSNDENLCNIFCSVADEPSSFWPWAEH